VYGILPVLRVVVEISLNNLNVHNLRQLVVHKQPLSVLEGGSVVITGDHLNTSPLKQSIKDVVRRDVATNLDVFFVVKETPVNGVLQVTLNVVFCSCKR